jgi:hypothetical protein
MFPRNPSRIFRSRWSALFWATGILFFAITTIGFGTSDQPANETTAVTDDSGTEVSNADMAVLKNFIGE